MKANNLSRAERQLNLDTGTATESRGGWLQGTVVLIEPSRDFLFLRAQEAKKKLFIRWAPETQFTVDGRPGSDTDLRLGQRVRLHCRFANHELAADNIAIEHGDDPGTPKTKVIPLHPDHD